VHILNNEDAIMVLYSDMFSLSICAIITFYCIIVSHYKSCLQCNITFNENLDKAHVYYNTPCVRNS